MNVGGLPAGTRLSLGFDGVGTKIEIAERTKWHETIAFDLFGMCVDDAVRYGAEPVLIGSVLDVNGLSGLNADGRTESFLPHIKQLARGYIRAAQAAEVAVINGEVAELRARVHGAGPFNYNWGAGVAYFWREDRELTGQKIVAGDAVVALREKGLRSNGYSLARKILQSTYGPQWHEREEGAELADLLLQPTRIYAPAVLDMVGRLDDEPDATVHGVAHITGGGIPGKLGRLLEPSKLGADLYNLFEPPRVMQELIRLGSVDLAEAYQTWNMGQGMLIVTPEPNEVVRIAQNRGIECRRAGEIVEQRGIVIQTSNRMLGPHWK
jgi:phosphoribosylformylglycinamidine cyclo-ligase